MSESDVPSRAVTGAIPAVGVLEELDGTPIAPAINPATPARIPWRRGVAAAVSVAAHRPRLWIYGLVAFLARGGVVVLALPIVVLPTIVGIANAVGPASLSPEGPTTRLAALIVAGIAACAVLVVTGTAVAAAAEVALHRATVEPDPDDVPGDGDLDGSFMVLEPQGDGRRAVARVVALRLALLVPVAAVAALAVPAWIGAAYRELTLPGDVAAPLILRVLAAAPGASLAVLVAWLGAELVGGFAARRAVLLGASAARALWAGLADPARAPVGTLLMVLAVMALSLVALLPATWAVGAAWDAARRVLAEDPGAPAALGVALTLTAAWIAALALAGIAAAGRATLMTAELLRREPGRASLAAPHVAPRAGGARHAEGHPPVG